MQTSTSMTLDYRDRSPRAVVVCVVDAGVDMSDEDLAAHVDLDRSSFVYDSKTDKLKGKGKIESKSSDHGTHVVGTRH